MGGDDVGVDETWGCNRRAEFRCSEVFDKSVSVIVLGPVFKSPSTSAVLLECRALNSIQTVRRGECAGIEGEVTSEAVTRKVIVFRCPA